MDIIAKRNKFDTEMIEIYTKDKEYLITVAHIDNFSELLNDYYNEHINDWFYDEVTLELKIKEDN